MRSSPPTACPTSSRASGGGRIASTDAFNRAEATGSPVRLGPVRTGPRREPAPARPSHRHVARLTPARECGSPRASRLCHGVQPIHARNRAEPPTHARLRRHPLIDPPRVLHQLRVENLLLIERAELGLGPASTPSPARPVPARRCSPMRSTCCSAASRGSASCGRALRRPTSRACSPCRPRCATRSPTGCPRMLDELVLARRVSAEGRTRALPRRPQRHGRRPG